MVSPLSRIRIYLAILACILVIGTLGLITFERLAPLDAVYFIIVTIATVGYGDITPKTVPGEILVMLIIVAGVGTFIAVIANAIEIVLQQAEQRERRRKVNMVIGAFFSEAGLELLRRITPLDPGISGIRGDLVVRGEWTAAEFARVRGLLAARDYRVDGAAVDFDGMRAFLREKRPFLLSLLENPALFEHDAFTDLLQAFFHLTEELLYRGDLSAIPATDRAHLVTDLERGYRLLVMEWLAYMEHLQQHFPYLFSLAMRTNPFDESAEVTVRE